MKSESVEADICLRTCETDEDCPGLACRSVDASKPKVCVVSGGRAGEPCNDATECLAPKAAAWRSTANGTVRVPSTQTTSSNANATDLPQQLYRRHRLLDGFVCMPAPGGAQGKVCAVNPK